MIDIELTFRPHPINHDQLLASNISTSFKIDLTEDIHDTISHYSVVISDFSGLLIDCWELGIETYCLCENLEEIYQSGIIFDWFYERLKLIRISKLEEVLDIADMDKLKKSQ